MIEVHKSDAEKDNHCDKYVLFYHTIYGFDVDRREYDMHRREKCVFSYNPQPSYQTKYFTSQSDVLAHLETRKRLLTSQYATLKFEWSIYMICWSSSDTDPLSDPLLVSNGVWNPTQIDVFS